MNRIAIVFFSASMLVSAQNFQPPSWGQGAGQGSGQGTGQGAGQGAGHGAGQGQGNQIQDQINQLQSQIENLRRQQRQMSRPPLQTQTGPVAGHPISGKETRQTTQKLADGTDITHSDTSSFYRDSSGRMRAEGPNGIEIFDPVAQVEYEVAPRLKQYAHSFFGGHVSYVSIAAYGNTTQSSIRSGSGTAKDTQSGVTEDLGKQMVNGVMATGSRVTITIPAGEIGNNREIKVVNERWYSDDLQVLIKSINTDPRFGVNVYELTDIKQTEPDISLFKVPADYKLVANPGELWRRN